jgi:hypothetical protein
MSDRGRYPAHTDHRLFMFSGVGSTLRRLARTGRIALAGAGVIAAATALAACGVPAGPVAAPQITMPGYSGAAAPSASPSTPAAHGRVDTINPASAPSEVPPAGPGGNAIVRPIDQQQTQARAPAASSSTKPPTVSSAPTSAAGSPPAPASSTPPAPDPSPTTSPTAPDPSPTTDPDPVPTDADPAAPNTCDNLLGCIVGLL